MILDVDYWRNKGQNNQKESERMPTQETKTVMHLPKCNIDITLNSICVDANDDALLNIEYDYDNDTQIDKQSIDDEIGEIIMQALRNSVEESES